MTDLKAIRARLEAKYPGFNGNVRLFNDLSTVLTLAEQQAAKIERLNEDVEALTDRLVICREKFGKLPGDAEGHGGDFEEPSERFKTTYYHD